MKKGRKIKNVPLISNRELLNRGNLTSELEALKENFKAKLERYLSDYRNCITSRVELYNSADRKRSTYADYWNRQGRGSFVSLTKTSISISVNEVEHIWENFLSDMKSLKKDVKNLPIDLETLESLKNILIKFKKQKDARAVQFEKREMRFQYEMNDGEQAASCSFAFIVNDVLGFLEKEIERKQAKYLLLITPNFIKHEGKDVFTFLAKEPFQFLFVDDVLKYIGVRKGVFSEMFKRIFKIPQDGEHISCGSKENIEKPDDTPREKNNNIRELQ